MIYRTPAKKSDNALFAKTILFLVLVLIIFVFFVPFSAVAKRLSTIWPISILSSWARGKETLVEENSRLKQEVAELKAEIVPEREGGISVNETMLSARVLRRPGNSPYDTILIDLGENQGVVLGEKVYLSNLLVGSVTGVYANEAIVSLYSAPGSEFTVLIGAEKHEATAKGLGGGVMEVLIPKGDKVEKSDRIISPLSSTNFFGKVESIEVLPEDAFQRVLFSTPFNIYTLERVYLKRQ